MRTSTRVLPIVLLLAVSFAACSLEKVGQGEPCIGKTCESGLACNRAYEPPRCEPYGKSGDLCAWRSECIDTLGCIPGPDGVSLCGTPLARNASCGTTQECTTPLVCRDEPLRCLDPGKAGEPCATSLDCAADLHCAGDATGSTCQTYRKQGESCTDGSQCADSMGCNLAMGGGQCQPRLEEGSPCADATDCRLALRCQGATCRAGAKEGDACTTADDCNWMPCNHALQAGDGTWGACHTAQSEGDACSDEVDCIASLTCVPTAPDLPVRGTCRPPLTLAKGAACLGVLLEDPQCAPGLECVMIDGSWSSGVGECRPWMTDGFGFRCTTAPGCEGLACNYQWGSDFYCRSLTEVVYRNAGEACPEEGDFCREGQTCNRAIDGGTCVAVLSGTSGDPCRSAWDCAVDLACNVGAGECAALGSVAKGEPCGMLYGYTWGLPCQEGLVCQDLLDPAICVPPGSGVQGDPCIDEDDCLPELLCLSENCDPGAQAGDDCDSTHPCGRGLVCNDFKCVAL